MDSGLFFLKRWDSEIFYAKKNLLMTILNDIILTLMLELDDKGEDWFWSKYEYI